LTSTLNFPSTFTGAGALTQTWSSFTSSAFNMNAGTHVLRVTFTGANQNLNWVKIDSTAPGANLLSNGAFNNDLLSWSSFFSTAAGLNAFDAGTGKITPGASGTDWWAQLYQTKAVPAGNYQLSANAQTLAGSKTIALFCEQDGGNYTSYGQTNCAITAAWNPGIGCTVTCNNVPAGVPIKFGVKGGLDQTPFRVDNFALAKL